MSGETELNPSDILSSVNLALDGGRPLSDMGGNNIRI